MFGYNHSPFLDLLIEQLELKWVPEVLDDEIHYPFISFPIARFLDGLWQLQQNRPNTKFLEVGCGIGTKMVLAHLAGFNVTGIELRPEYIEVAKELCGKFDFEPNIIQIDALDFNDYYSYDCIYTYRPFANWADEWKLEEHIINTCQPSAMLFIPGTNYPLQRGWKKSIHEVWNL